MTIKFIFASIIFLYFVNETKSVDPCSTPRDARSTLDECIADDEIYEYFDFQKQKEEERTKKIRGKIDPQDSITPSENPLKPVSEYTGLFPIDSIVIFIIIFPFVGGVILLKIARFFEPEIIQDTSRNRYGYRIRMFPTLPVSYLQQTDKDKQYSKVKRNSVGWFCHKWFFNTNDLIQEVMPDKVGKPEKANHWEKVQFIGNMYTFFRNMKEKKGQWDDVINKIYEARAKGVVLDGNDEMRHIKHRDMSKLFPNLTSNLKKEMQDRQPKLKKLYLKLTQWMEEFPEREMKRLKLNKQETKLKKQKSKKTKTKKGKPIKKPVPDSETVSVGDSDDSYWGSSETFESDYDVSSTSIVSEPTPSRVGKTNSKRV